MEKKEWGKEEEREGRRDGGRGKRERREATWEEASCLLHRNLVQPALLRFLLKP